jgi:hypothetical protein
MCDGLRIKNLVRQGYGFVIQFCRVTELLSVGKEHNSIELVITHAQSIDIIETKFNMRNSAYPPMSMT